MDENRPAITERAARALLADGACQPQMTHRFDEVSGWCLNGCGRREDGRWERVS